MLDGCEVVGRELMIWEAARWTIDRRQKIAEEDARALGLGDPAVMSQLATFEVCAMPGAIVGRP